MCRVGGGGRSERGSGVGCFELVWRWRSENNERGAAVKRGEIKNWSVYGNVDEASGLETVRGMMKGWGVKSKDELSH